MTLAGPILSLPRAAPPTRAIALRPVSASSEDARTETGPQFEAELLREDELRRLRAPAEVEGRSAYGGAKTRSFQRPAEHDEPHEDEPEAPSFPLGSPAFLAQLFAQEEPAEETALDPFGDAVKAYGRLAEERRAGLIIDVPNPVDVEA